MSLKLTLELDVRCGCCGDTMDDHQYDFSQCCGECGSPVSSEEWSKVQMLKQLVEQFTGLTAEGQ